MRKRRLGDTKFETSELVLGTWGLSGDGYTTVPEIEQDKVIDRALAVGITSFDTADSYAQGAMERRLGERVPQGDKHFIITKIGTCRKAQPPRKRFDPAYLREAFEQSRERLKRKPFAVLLHNPSPVTLERGEATSVLSDLKKSGELELWGVSVNTAAAARAALARGADMLELPYNIFYAHELHDLQTDLSTRNVALLAHSVLAYGMLCGKWTSDKEFHYEDHRSERWTADEFRRRIRQLDAVRPVVGGDVLSMRAAALRYVLGNPHVSGAVLGPRSAIQFDQLVREAGREPPYLSDEKRFALEARLRDLGVNT
jgi:aryl-alcohol dehydrogenase-like predicted oxidoreductase